MTNEESNLASRCKSGNKYINTCFIYAESLVTEYR